MRLEKGIKSSMNFDNYSYADKPKEGLDRYSAMFHGFINKMIMLKIIYTYKYMHVIGLNTYFNENQSVFGQLKVLKLNRIFKSTFLVAGQKNNCILPMHNDSDTEPDFPFRRESCKLLLYLVIALGGSQLLILFFCVTALCLKW